MSMDMDCLCPHVHGWVSMSMDRCPEQHWAQTLDPKSKQSNTAAY
ncbi:28366_t:CDS:2 [Gigaspora margarita]|uniref:28366_t:CDS:1 n=1 Tax=Gigaspora margarita TaxID=4874 RepID=A0ABM8VWE9_GIGMA|nr:28366_t:CDS:2 [Gigaspora margarita]